MVLLLSQTPSLPKSQNYERIGIIFVTRDGGYTVLRKQINTDCDTWWSQNLKIIKNNLNPKPYQSHVLHLINGKIVIGYICNY